MVILLTGYLQKGAVTEFQELPREDPVCGQPGHYWYWCGRPGLYYLLSCLSFVKLVWCVNVLDLTCYVHWILLVLVEVLGKLNFNYGRGGDKRLLLPIRQLLRSLI